MKPLAFVMDRFSDALVFLGLEHHPECLVPMSEKLFVGGRRKRGHLPRCPCDLRRDDLILGACVIGFVCSLALLVAIISTR